MGDKGGNKDKAKASKQKANKKDQKTKKKSDSQENKRVFGKQQFHNQRLPRPFIVFALGRAAGGAGEFLDHRDFGTEMDMRIPVKECRSLMRPRKL